MKTKTIPARELREGDMIPGLDNAYVAEVEENDGYLSYPGGNGAMPEDTILVTFHDSMGEENYMLLNPDSMLTIQR